MKKRSESYEDARRLAKLLVTELELYCNADQLRRARETGGIRALLGDDLSRSRQMFLERAQISQIDADEIFGAEVVARLAAGDASKLSGPAPERPESWWSRLRKKLGG